MTPEGWRAATLDEVCEFRRGLTWKKNQERREPAPGRVPVLRIPNVKERLDLSDLLWLEGISPAASELHEALLDLSKRPKADATGAIQHAIASLECVVRDVMGDPKATLGALIANHRDEFPAPLDQAITKLWGYASENGRHVREGRSPGHREALYVVHIAAATIRYVMDSLPDDDGR